MALKLITNAAMAAPEVGTAALGAAVKHIGAYPPLDNSVDLYMDGRSILTGSATATLIEKTIMESEVRVGILFTDQADSMHIPGHILAGHATLSAFTGGIALCNPNSLMTPSAKWKGAAGHTGPLPLGISLFHELGHAKQGIERSVWYDERTKKALSGNEEAKLEVEQDNLARHENLMCDELGLPYRRQYND